MPDPLHDDRLMRYLLHDLSPEEYLAFQETLDESPSTRAQLRELGNDLREWSYGHSAEIVPPKRVWEAVRERIRTETRTHPPESVKFPLWQSIPFWRAAAIILLALNLLWLAPQVLVSRRAAETPKTTDSAITLASQTNSGSPTEMPADRFPPDAPGLTGDPTDLQMRLRESEIRVLELREELLAAQRTRRHIEQDRDHLISRLNAFFQPSEGRGHLTLIELHPEGTEPSTLIDEIQQSLLDSGNAVAAADVDGSTSNTDQGPPIVFDSMRGAGDFGQEFNGIAVGYSTTDANVPLQDESMDNATGTPQTSESVEQDLEARFSTGAEVINAPSTVLIWRDDLQVGQIDFPGLADPAPGSQYNLWAKGSESSDYILIGVLPASGGEVLKIDFTINQPDFNPTEIILTEESSSTTTQPVGNIILKGP